MKRLVLAVAVIVSACTAGSDDGAPPPTDREVVTTTAAPDTLPPPASTTAPERTLDFDGVTVTDDTIYLGMLADLSGPFSGLVVDIVDAQLAFWADLNERGGIAGRQVELLISDTAYDLEKHAREYEGLRDRVVMFAHSTGSPHTAQIAQDLMANDRLATVATWYSGWADPGFGANVLETGSNYCLEAMNALTYIAGVHQAQAGVAPRIAIATDAGDYGQDSAAGAKHLAEQLGLEIAYDGEAAIQLGGDLTSIGASIARSGADWTWLATDPTSAAVIVRAAIQQGYAGAWSGAMPSFSPRLLDTALGDYLSEAWLLSALFAPIGADVDGMDAVYAVLADAFPDRYPSDALIKGYLEFDVARQVLQRAAELGDLTPAGVVAAAQSLGTLVFNGLSPANVYAGSANEAVTRATALYQPSKELFDAQGGIGARLGDGAVSPFELLQEFFVSPVASEYPFTGPCYTFGS